MSYLPLDKSTNADVSFHYFSGFSSPYYEFSIPSTLGAGVTRPSSTSFVLASGRSYWLRGVISFVRGTNNYNRLNIENQWTVGGIASGFKASIVSGISNQSDILTKNPTNRPEALIFIPSSAITTSVTVQLKQTYINADNGNTTLTYSMDANFPCGCVIMSVPD
jgi:hypothetical protein